MKYLGAAMLGVVVCAPAQAAKVIDQQNTVATGEASGTGVNTTFRPTLTGIDFATLLARTGGQDSILFLELYEGFGPNRILIGEAASVTVSGTTFTEYTWQFASRIALTPDALYTLNWTTKGINRPVTYGFAPDSDPYPRGGRNNQMGDIVFSQGIITPDVAAVPEPSTWALLIGGFGAVGFALRRRRRTAVRFAW